MATAAQAGAGKGPESKKPKEPAEQVQPPRPISEIRVDIDQTRARLAGNLEQLRAETSPQALGARASSKVKSLVMYEDGSIRVERVAAAAGVVVGLLVLRRGFQARARRKEFKALAEVVWVPVPRRSVNPELAARARNAKELAPLSAAYEPRLALAHK